MNIMCEKLNYVLTAPKPFQNIIISFLSKKNISAILPLLVAGETTSSFSQKAPLFNGLIASQCTPLQFSNGLPNFFMKTKETLSSLNISEDDILLLLLYLTSNKCHGLGNILIRMIKLCEHSLVYQSKLIFEASLQGGKFLDY